MYTHYLIDKNLNLPQIPCGNIQNIAEERRSETRCIANAVCRELRPNKIKCEWKNEDEKTPTRPTEEHFEEESIQPKARRLPIYVHINAAHDCVACVHYTFSITSAY